MVLIQITNLHSNGGLNLVENVNFGNNKIGNLDTRLINVGAETQLCWFVDAFVCHLHN